MTAQQQAAIQQEVQQQHAATALQAQAVVSQQLQALEKWAVVKVCLQS